MSSRLTLGSLFDGSGGFPLGGLICGIDPLWASEIEPFPIRVTTKRMPFVKHYGDVSKMDGGNIEPVDIVTFGSPCQDMSVAGKRNGLDGSRSSLFYEAIRIIKEMRRKTNGKYPKYIVWENVPGAFSSNKGEDFRCVLESVCRICDETAEVPSADKWQPAGEILGDNYSVAWRVLDAQYWGVPQRRKRIYLVADLTGGSAGKILFESESLSGYSKESFRAWQRTAAGFEEGTGTAGTEDGSLVLCDQGGNRMDVLKEKTSTLRAEAHHPPIVIENHPSDSRVKISENNVVQTLSGRCGTGGNNVPLLLKIRSGCEGGGKGALIQKDKSATLSCNNDQTLFEPKVYGICSKGSNSMKSDNPKSGFYEADTTRTLDANGGRPDCAQGGMAVVSIEGNGTRPSHNGDGWSEKNISYTLNATEQHGVAYGTERESAFCSSKASFFMDAIEDKANTLVATDYKDPPIVNDKAESADDSEPEYVVRRLTPTECARLQGFPDWWCADLGTEKPTDEELYFWYKVFETHRSICGGSAKPKSSKMIQKWLENPYSDSAEYKMWGNGVALPCVVFVLAGIAYYDGIAGL